MRNDDDVDGADSRMKPMDENELIFLRGILDSPGVTQLIKVSTYNTRCVCSGKHSETIDIPQGSVFDVYILKYNNLPVKTTSDESSDKSKSFVYDKFDNSNNKK